MLSLSERGRKGGFQSGRVRRARALANGYHDSPRNCSVCRRMTRYYQRLTPKSRYVVCRRCNSS